ncbi:hypothetical protein OCU04_000558 [Sclerotinia nivalis]|uniref:WD repeat-containing protein JIP5 n=1 Tax=Sclerotinia nivalis TaxID=352851 RepID=A0A9X0AWB8_9HELO|nr:hypothetical protein OCU04_000558 [Sclerotinia nivalis]
MFENLCTLPLSSELFTQALHPTEPILSVGLSAGHVQSFRLPAAESSPEDEDGDTSVLSTGTSTIDTEWRTRRHKGSCRTLGYSHDGEVLYSAGTDSLLKAAASATGQVISKIRIPNSSTDALDPPTLLHALSPQTLLLATDSCALHLYDLRDVSSFKSGKPAQTHYPHDDYISSLSPLPPTEMSTSGFSKQWVTTGGTTLAVTDLRRGVLVKSEDQEEELLSSVFVSGLPARGKFGREKVCVGNGNGIITLWEKGVWDDQSERIIVDGGGKAGGESLDSMVAVPEDLEGSYGGKCVVVGCGDGSVRVVRVGGKKGVVEDLKHDDIEAVVAVGFDVGGRLISGGGETVKVWQEKVEDEEDEDEEEEQEDIEDNDEVMGESGKRTLEKDSDDSDAKADTSDEEDGGRKKHKKKKRGKKGQVGNGILGFKGME